MSHSFQSESLPAPESVKYRLKCAAYNIKSLVQLSMYGTVFQTLSVLLASLFLRDNNNNNNNNQICKAPECQKTSVLELLILVSF